MKRVLIQDMPWQKLQNEYDSGESIRDLAHSNRMASKTFIKASKLGLFKLRNLSEAGKVRAKIKPNDYSIVRHNRTEFENYRADCAFKFNLSDYPDEFDFSLIESFGWYKPKNRGNNLIGISRDHMISVRYGFDNKIPPEHLSHPANCMLLKHGENVSKGTKNSITYEELLKRIESWNRKYQ